MAWGPEARRTLLTWGWESHFGELQLIINVFNTFVLVEETLLTLNNQCFISRFFLIYDNKSCILLTKCLF